MKITTKIKDPSGKVSSTTFEGKTKNSVKESTDKQLSKSQQWFANNKGYDHFKTGNTIKFDNKEWIIKRVSIANGKLEPYIEDLNAPKGYYINGSARNNYIRIIDTQTVQTWSYGENLVKIMGEIFRLKN